MKNTIKSLFAVTAPLFTIMFLFQVNVIKTDKAPSRMPAVVSVNR